MGPPEEAPLRDIPRRGRDSLVAFPAGRVHHLPTHNLPHDLTSFVGREREMEEVGRLLGESRLLTLAGPGGCGKTRLALAAARGLAESFEGGAWLVELAAVSNLDIIPQAVAEALSVREQPGRPLDDTLIEHLRSRELLLILDNCEHLVGACAHFAQKMLTSCARLQILATSREPLGVAGEINWRVPSLSLPEESGPLPAERLIGYEAVRLFVERARSRLPGFEITQENALAVSDICRRLEGMPLAIELATARLTVLSARQVSERLENTLSLLAAGDRACAPRHRTLRGALDWSYDLLDEEEGSLLRKLSVFAGGFSLEAAEAVGDGMEALDPLGRLVDKSLVLVARKGEELRYRLLEPVRQYGLEKAEKAGEKAAVRRRHAGFFLELAERAEPELSGPDQGPWMKRLEAEHDNLRGSLEWFRENGDIEQGFRLGGALWRFWWMQGRFTEGRRQLEALLKLPGAEARTEARAKALYVLGVLACRQADHAAGNQDEARAYQRESLEIYRKLGDESHIADALRELGRIGIELGDWEAADSFLNESLRLERESGSEYGVALTLNSLGWLAHFQGDNVAARPFFERARKTFRNLGDDLYADICAFFLGRIATDEGDYAQARAMLAATVDDRLPQYPWVIPPLLEAFAGLAAARGHAARALKLTGAAAALREIIGVAHAPAWQADLTRRLESARRALDKREAAVALGQGRAMTPEEAIAYALEEAEPSSDGLTPREVEVLRILASGKTNKEIAAGLHLSTSTVERHVANVYKKIEARGRAEATAYALGRGFAQPSGLP